MFEDPQPNDPVQCIGCNAPNPPDFSCKFCHGVGWLPLKQWLLTFPLQKEKKMSDKSAGGSGIGFIGLLTILFIGLKLTNHIDWSWLWVLSPLWIPFALLLTAVVVAYTVAGFTTVAEKIIK